MGFELRSQRWTSSTGFAGLAGTEVGLGTEGLEAAVVIEAPAGSMKAVSREDRCLRFLVQGFEELAAGMGDG